MPTAWQAPRLAVDGTPASKIDGPYTAASGVNFSGVFGTSRPAATLHHHGHRQARHLSQYTGSFAVPAAVRADLLTAVMHEMGDLLGDGPSTDGLMEDVLPLGGQQSLDALQDDAIGPISHL